MWMLLACGATLPSDLPADRAAPLEACLERSAPTGDWCAYEVLQSDSAYYAPWLATVCLELRADEPRSRCLELALRSKYPPPPEVCDQVPAGHLRSSCVIHAVDVVLAAEDVSLERAIELCEPAGELAPHCLVHVIWAHEWDGLPALVEGVDQMLVASPESSEVETFGQAVGATAVRLGKPALLACRALPEGVAHEACRAEVDAAR
ncbi:MAG: hypothetical protein GY913_12175 [Proteobacteria bacterium]|nr:hypothetical protein [Pseudomonadota bacterium]